MNMVRTKDGEIISTKEFIRRWKEGCNELTPLQSNKIQLRGTRITMLGIVCGLVISVINYRMVWWLGLILLGALFNTWVQYAGLMQQKKLFNNIENQFKDDIFDGGDE